MQSIYAVAHIAGAGKHVLLEKPMAPTLEDAAAILAAAEASSNVFMMAENSQYWPEVIRAQELIAQGAVGELLSGRGWYAFANVQALSQ